MYGCPEHTNPMYRKCVHQKSFNDCCAKNIICDKEEIEKLPTCSFDNRIYRLGETIYPKDFPCHKCICGENFDGSKVEDNPQCQIVDCGIEITNFNKIRKGCVPVYFENRCCPITYRCRKLILNKQMYLKFNYKIYFQHLKKIKLLHGMKEKLQQMSLVKHVNLDLLL